MRSRKNGCTEGILGLSVVSGLWWASFIHLINKSSAGICKVPSTKLRLEPLIQPWTHRNERREQKRGRMKEVQVSGGGLENRILQMFSDFLKWTERKLRFQLMAHPTMCLEFVLTPPRPAPAFGGTYSCESQLLDSEGGGNQQEMGLRKEWLLLLFFKICFNLHKGKLPLFFFFYFLFGFGVQSLSFNKCRVVEPASQPSY